MKYCKEFNAEELLRNVLAVQLLLSLVFMSGFIGSVAEAQAWTTRADDLREADKYRIQLAQLGQRPPLQPAAPLPGEAKTEERPAPPPGNAGPDEATGAQETVNAVTPEGGQAPPVEQPKEPVGRPKPQKRAAAGATLSFFFDDADIYEVIQTIFGDVLRSNYIIDPKVKGRVNFRTINPIPKEEVLTIMEIIFRLNGIGFVEEKGLYRIVPLTDVPLELVRSQTGKSPDDVAIEMFTFKNLNIKEAMQDIEGAIGLSLTEGKARVLPIYRLNALLVIAASKSELDYVRKWIEVFDTMFANARQKINVYPLQNTKASHVASMLQSIFGGGGGAGAPKTPTPTPTPQRPATTPGGTAAPAAPAAPKAGPSATITGTGSLISEDTKIFADEIMNALIILATPTDYAFIEETIKKIDIVPRQVMIEAYLIGVDLTDNLNVGFSWSLATDIAFSMKPFTNPVNLLGDLFQQPPLVTGNTALAPSTEGFTFIATDPSGIVRAKIVAALKDFRAQVLAAPHVVVADNREARIQVGKQIPIATSQTASPIGTADQVVSSTTSTVQYKDIGIILKVKPQINDSGLVSLELSQEVSRVGDDVITAGVRNVSIDKTEATTNLVAQSGETLIIGGLIREDDRKTKTGIPLLSQIPLIGYLFANTTSDVTRQELIMVLTPRVMRSMDDAKNLTLDYVRRYNKAAQDDRIENFIKERSGGEQPAQQGAQP